MKKFEREIGRIVWYCASLGGLLLLIAGTALSQGGVEIVFELPEASVTASEPVYVRLSIQNGLGEEVGFVPERYNDNYFDLLPDERKAISLELEFSEKISAPAHGRLIIEGSNVAASEIPISVNP